MEKYLRGLDGSGGGASLTISAGHNNDDIIEMPKNGAGGGELSKWLESAANFTPKKNNYIEWDPAR